LKKRLNQAFFQPMLNMTFNPNLISIKSGVIALNFQQNQPVESDVPNRTGFLRSVNPSQFLSQNVFQFVAKCISIDTCPEGSTFGN